MKKLLFLPVLLFLLLVGCSSNDDNANNNQAILGPWFLKVGNGTISGRIDQFEDGQITWTFNNDGTVDVINTVTDPSLLSGFPTGTYTYTVSQNNSGIEGCSHIVKIGNVTFSCSVVSQNTLEINEGIADGIGYDFQRQAMPVTQ